MIQKILGRLEADVSLNKLSWETAVDSENIDKQSSIDCQCL